MDEPSQDELESRLTRLESTGGGGMVQPDLPWSDVIAAAVAILLVSALLLWWVA